MWNRFRRVIHPSVFSPKKDFTVNIGETFYMDVFIYEGIETDSYEVGDTPITFTAKDDPYEPTLVLTKDRDNGIVVMDDAAGYVRIEFSEEDTNMLGATGGRVVYDVSITDDEGTTFLVAYGSLYLRNPVS